MQILLSTSYCRMAWKNGGGTTTEVAIAPAGATLEAFAWRVSMAHVAGAGPFSIFPGVDRTLAVTEGAGIVLHPAGRGAVRLDAATPPFAFPADLPIDATLVDGAIDDLNVMTRRGLYRHLVSRLRLGAPTVLPRHGETMIVLARGRGARLRVGAESAVLAPHDAVMLTPDDPAAVELAPDGEGDYFAIDLWRCA